MPRAPELAASKVSASAATSAAFDHAGMQGMYAQQMQGMQQQPQGQQGQQVAGCQQQPAAQQMQYPGY